MRGNVTQVRQSTVDWTAVGDVVGEGRAQLTPRSAAVLSPRVSPRAASDPGADTAWAKTRVVDQILCTPIVQKAIAHACN